MDIFVVTSGEYSDYSIQAIFLNKQDAKKYVADYNRTHRWGEADIEEWDAHEGPVEFLPFYTLTVELEVLPHMEGLGPRRSLLQIREPGERPTEHVIGSSFPRTKVRHFHGGDGVHRMAVEGFSKEKVLKVARDRVAKFRAEKEGL